MITERGYYSDGERIDKLEAGSREPGAPSASSAPSLRAELALGVPRGVVRFDTLSPQGYHRGMLLI
jgi:hypothetical protein